MKKITKILAGLALVGSMAACTDGNDWDVDGSETGLFRPTSPKAEQTAKGETTISFTFTGVPGATGYQIETTTDSATFVASDEVSSDNILTEATSSPVEQDGFTIGKTYYSRLRAISANGKSAWVGISKVKMEEVNLFTDADATSGSITFLWTVSSKVTKIILMSSADSVVVESVDLNEAAISAGSYEFSGLAPVTSYIAELYAGDNRCGSKTVSTLSKSGPASDYEFRFDATKTMQEQLDVYSEKVAEGGSVSVTVIIPSGVAGLASGYDSSTSETTALTIPNGLSVYFYGERGDAKDELTIYKQLNLGGNHAKISFQNLTVKGEGYVLNNQNDIKVDSLVFKDCKVSGFTSSTFLRVRGGSIENLVIDNSIVSNCGKGYAFIHMDGGVINNIDIEKTTFVDICVTGKNFLLSNKNANINSLKIKDVTFYNFCGGGNTFIDFKDASNGPASSEFTNIIFGKSATTETNKNMRGTCDSKEFFTNCYGASDCYKIQNRITMLDKTSAEIFADPDNGDFTLKAGCGVEKCGDPRWYTTAE